MKALADLILPRICVVCGQKLTLDEEHICRWCRDDMPLTRFWLLKHNPMADKFNEAIQKELERQWRAHERYAYAVALFFFNEDADYKRIPYRIKYEGDMRAGKHFGKVLGEHISKAEWFKDIDAIIPVPLHWRRKFKRGYNQAEVIARGISEATGIPIRTDILKRRRNTKTQINLDIPQKASNVQGAFSVAQADNLRHTMQIDGQRHTMQIDVLLHILLVDDVFTSGATLHACFLALRSVFPPAVRISIATLGFVGRG